jgi:hypothetical protein
MTMTPIIEKAPTHCQSRAIVLHDLYAFRDGRGAV